MSLLIILSSFFLIGNDIIELQLTGTILVNQKYSYTTVPFEVPTGIGRLEISYEYTNRTQGSQLEIGLLDPDGFRGTSRNNKRKFQVSRYQTTPSYFPGNIQEGVWHITFAIPAISLETEYMVTIKMISEKHSLFTGPHQVELNHLKQWYKGDFHTHTGHSDAFGCRDLLNQRIPCQVFHVAEAALKSGLDFVAINDHNTVSHHQDIFVIQPAYPTLLLIRGQEVTTYFGHSNVLGTSIPLDFKVVPDGASFNTIFKESDGFNALNILAHPGRETGDSCTGCGWSYPLDTFKKVHAIEVINGTDVESETSGIPFWHNLLNLGYKITAIGGSDDHGGGFGRDKPGNPTTVVYADALSEEHIINGVKNGRAYVKTLHELDIHTDFWVNSSDGLTYYMGDVISIKDFTEFEIQIEIQSLEQLYLEIIQDGNILSKNDVEITFSPEKGIYTFKIEGDYPRWIRYNLRDENDSLVVLSNPIFFEKTL